MLKSHHMPLKNFCLNEKYRFFDKEANVGNKCFSIHTSTYIHVFPVSPRHSWMQNGLYACACACIYTIHNTILMTCLPCFHSTLTVHTLNLVFLTSGNSSLPFPASLFGSVNVYILY